MKLKPCECGHHVELIEEDNGRYCKNGWYYITCASADCLMRTDSTRNKEYLIDWWNNRHEHKPVRIEELEEGTTIKLRLTTECEVICVGSDTVELDSDLFGHDWYHINKLNACNAEIVEETDE